MNKELEFLEEKHGDNSWGHYPPSKREVAQWLQEWTEKQFAIYGVSKSLKAKHAQDLFEYKQQLKQIDNDDTMYLDNQKEWLRQTCILAGKISILENL